MSVFVFILVMIPCDNVDSLKVSEKHTAAVFISVVKVEATYIYEALVHGVMTQKTILLWHVDLLLGSDLQTVRQRPKSSNRGSVSVRSVPKYSQQDR
jgi:hypothetical protein